MPPPFLVILGLPIEPTSTCIDIVLAFAGENVPPPLQETTFDAILPRGVLTYNVTDDLSVFFSGQRGYRAGGTFTFLAASDGDSVGTTIELGTFDPEFLTPYEIGFRSEWLENRLTFNGNIFLNFLDDQQLTVAGPTGTEFDTQTINAGESRIFGAEFNFDYKVTDELDIYGSLGLLDTEFTDFPFAESGLFENLNGNEFPVAPNVSFTLGTSYQHRSSFFGSGSISFQGPQESQIFNLDENDILPISFAADPDNLPGGLPSPDVLDSLLTEEVGSRFLANVRIGYAHDNFSIAFFASNLFDDQTPIFRIRGLVNQETGELGPSASASQIVPDPRTFGVVLDIAF
ncbi:MAG: TonB-dependent receptor [Pseudomonadota bacterium]